MSNALTRIGTANMYDNTLRNLGERQSSLVGLQENLTAGKRVVRASDDPVAAAQAERNGRMDWAVPLRTGFVD